jgi:hypothetical protein
MIPLQAKSCNNSIYIPSILVKNKNAPAKMQGRKNLRGTTQLEENSSNSKN